MIREARQRAGVSVATLAERVGVAPNTVYRWERGEVTPTIDNVQNIGEALGMRAILRFE